MGNHMKKSLPNVAQIVGAVCVVAAVTALAGWAWALLLAGVLIVTGALLTEAGWL